MEHSSEDYLGPPSLNSHTLPRKSVPCPSPGVCPGRQIYWFHPQSEKIWKRLAEDSLQLLLIKLELHHWPESALPHAEIQEGQH